MAHGNLFFRYLLEGCLDITICATLNFIDAYNKEDLAWNSFFYFVNNVFLVVLSAVTIILPAFISLFYCLNFSRWSDREFDDKYGAIYEGLRKD